MKRLFTFVVLCLTLGVFITPVKAEEKVNTNEWITVDDDKEHLYEFIVQNTGYQYLEYNFTTDFATVKIYDGSMREIGESHLNDDNSPLKGVMFYSCHPKGTTIYISVYTTKIYKKNGNISFIYKDIEDKRVPRAMDDLSESTELKDKVWWVTHAKTTYDVYKYKVKESGTVDFNLKWTNFRLGGLYNENSENNISIINEDGIFVDYLYPIIKKKNKLTSYLKKGTYYIVVRLSNRNGYGYIYELTAKNKKNNTVEHEWNRAVEGNTLQKLKLNKEVMGKISFGGAGNVYNELRKMGYMTEDQREYDNDSFDFIAPNTKTYTFTVTPVKSRLEKLKSIVWLDVDTDKYVELIKKGKNLVANVPLKKGQKVYINVYNGFGGQHYKVKVK